MKLVIISDTHFGDPMGTLVDHQTLDEGAKFADFAGVAGKQNDFLVLLGDIFDFSITSCEEAYKRAKVFFQLVKDQRIAKNIIYVPGNHDVDMWNTVQQQIKIMYQVRQGKPALSYVWSLPGFIDDRTESPSRGFQLPGVIGPVDPDREPSTEKLFLNGITNHPDGGGTDTNFYIAYPNLYMVTDTESILLTHGHYLEAFWAISGALIQQVAKEDLRDTDTVEDMVALNAPLCQLACSGIGQAGKLTLLVQRVQREVKDGNLERIKHYFDALPGAIKELARLRLIKSLSWWRRGIIKICVKLGKGQLIKTLEKSKDTRYNEDFETRAEIQERFKYYYRVTCDEINQLNGTYDFRIDLPQKLIFGHTHRPRAWHDPSPAEFPVAGKNVQRHNTGGWLWRTDSKGQREFCGAEVFVYDSASGFKSHRID